MKKNIVPIIIVLLFIFGITFIMNNQTNEYKKSFFYMDTLINIKIYTKNDEILDEVDAIFKKYHQLTNRYEGYDDLKNVYYLNNELENGEEVIIDDDLSAIIKYGIESHLNSNGHINIAIGNLVDVWKKYRDGEKIGVPSKEELDNIKSISIEDISLIENKYTKQNDVKIDLGALVKGYVVDKVAILLEERGIDKYLINAGGNVRVGKHYKGDKYRVGINDPLTNGIFTTLKITDNSIVTSGGYERFYIYEGVRYHHIIDTKTFFPPQNDFASVTIITPNAAKADLMSTYLFLNTYEEGLKIAEENNIDAIWYFNDGTTKSTKGVSNYE